MLSKCIKIFVLYLFVFLAFGIYVHYDLIQEQPKSQYMCHKGKLIKSMEIENIYLQVKDTKCVVFEDLIIVDKGFENERSD